MGQITVNTELDNVYRVANDGGLTDIAPIGLRWNQTKGVFQLEGRDDLCPTAEHVLRTLEQEGVTVDGIDVQRLFDIDDYVRDTAGDALVVRAKLSNELLVVSPTGTVTDSASVRQDGLVDPTKLGQMVAPTTFTTVAADPQRQSNAQYFGAELAMTVADQRTSLPLKVRDLQSWLVHQLTDTPELAAVDLANAQQLTTSEKATAMRAVISYPASRRSPNLKVVPTQQASEQQPAEEPVQL